MSGQLQTLVVFLASPGDVPEERRAARDVVRRLNTALQPTLRLHIELLGWEDTQPGYGRPQEKINADVRVCDLFIGILAKRWGSATATHTSGFHEEFELAQGLRASTSTPEIWLFLKELS